MKRFLKTAATLLAILVVVFLFGPRPDTEQTYAFDADAIGSDPDAYLETAEAAFTDIRPGLAKGIVWADPAARAKTPVGVVYIHGFSASRVETEPVASNVAKALGANLYFTRLAGHGRSGDAMAEARLTDWFSDVAEAMAIGKKLGEKLLVISASTGSTLSVWAASRPELSDGIAGLAMISPNFATQAVPTSILNLPWAETLLPMVMGQERSWEPKNEGHASGWTTRYPSRAIFPMAALLKIVDGIDPASVTTPAIFIYSNRDTVIVPERVADAAARWGGPVETLVVDDSGDPDHHVIAGDVMSPQTTGRVSEAIINWARTL